MDPNNLGLPQQNDGMNVGSLQQQPQQTQNTAAPANPNFMASLMGQLSQMQQQQGAPQPAVAGGIGGAPQQVPLLVGATPLQQQLSALQGLAGGQPGNQNNVQGQDQTQQAQPQGIPQGLFFGGQAQQGQNQGIQQPQQQQQQQIQQQQQPQQQMQQPQMQQQPQMPNMGMQQLGMMAQNPLLGANLGFNVQQLQQLQLAQQLMAAGLPPQLAFGGQPLMGAGGFGLAPTPQLAALASSNPAAAALGMAAPANAAALGGTQAAMPNMPSSNAGVATAAAEPAAKAAASTVGEGQDWAEPFSGKGKKEPPFPLKLHQILSNPEFQECICWNPHGRSWRILKPPVFEQLVIPLYFRYVDLQACSTILTQVSYICRCSSFL